MDPLTQGLLGAAAAGGVFHASLGRRAALIGVVGGMLADADVFFGPWTDPALPQALHRHFTHALVFIPVGGALAAAPFFCRRWYRQRYPAVLGAATLAYATHGLLDCCTSYGTLWLWPFSTTRVAWDWIAIIDPVFTVTLLLGVIWELWRDRARPATIALLLAGLYMGLGVLQHHRAVAAMTHSAADRGHAAQRLRLMPTLGNLVLWRSLYVNDDQLHADAVRVSLWGEIVIRTGGDLPLYQPTDVPADTPQRGRVVDVLRRFSHFADGYTALAPSHRDVVADMRYSAATEGFMPLWGIRLDPTHPRRPVVWGQFQYDRRAAINRLWRGVMDDDALMYEP